MTGPTAGMWELLSSSAAAAVLVVGLLAYGVWRRRWGWLLGAGLAVAVTDPLCARVLKPAFERDRPCRVLPEVHTAGGCRPGLGLPSVHAANTAALAAATGSPPMFLVAGLVGIGRVVQGQHWPSDVCAGWLVGGLVGAGAGALGRRVQRRLDRREAGAPRAR